MTERRSTRLVSPTPPRIHRLNLYKPHAGQLPLHASPFRFNAVCFGRQSGKTTFGLNKIADRAWTGPKDGVYWYILQTYDAAKIAFRRMYAFYRMSPRAFDKKPNESELLCRFRHGPTIEFKSGKNYEDLRAETLDGAVIDEYRQQHPRLFSHIIRPMLSAKRGWADILSTPNGFDHFYDLFEAAKNDPEWGHFHAPSTVAPWWSPEEVASSMRTMSEPVYAQEILAEFRDLFTGKAYSSFGQHNLAESSPFTTDGSLISPYLPIIVGLDFNVGHMRWVLGQHRVGKIYWFDEIAIDNTNTAECAKELGEKVKGHAQGVVLIGDATGNSRHTSATQSDYVIVGEALDRVKVRWENQTPESNPAVKERVNTMNARLRAADKTVSMWINPKTCPKLKRDMDRVAWKVGAQTMLDQKKDPSLTHASDAAGYATCVLAPMESEGAVGTMGVIHR